MDYTWALLLALLSPVVSVAVATGQSNKKFEGVLGEIRAEVRNLKHETEKHNQVIERTYKLESDQKTLFFKVDELKDNERRIEDKVDDLREEVHSR